MNESIEDVCLIGQELAIRTGGGKELYLPLPMLRRSCPCALCQGEPDTMGRVLKPTVDYGPKSFELRRFELVGGYGLQLHWADGHGTGIYSLTYLRKLEGMTPGQ
ncbi:MAG: DUF971 domain-containing protein [Akkermansiaceae bacterium]